MPLTTNWWAILCSKRNPPNRKKVTKKNQRKSSKNARDKPKKKICRSICHQFVTSKIGFSIIIFTHEKGMFHVWMLFCLWWPALFCISFYTSLAAAIAHFIYLFTIISSSLQTLTTMSLAFKAAATAARSEEKERNTSSLHNQPSAQKQQRIFVVCVRGAHKRQSTRCVVYM